MVYGKRFCLAKRHTNCRDYWGKAGALGYNDQNQDAFSYRIHANEIKQIELEVEVNFPLTDLTPRVPQH